MNGSVDYTNANKTTDIRRVSTFGLTTFLITAIFLLPVGVIGNLMVIVVVRKRRYLQTKTNFLLANLAACDLVANILGYTWGVASAFPIPNMTRCGRTWGTTAKATFWTTGFIIFVVVPLIVMLFCYVQIIRALYFGTRIVPMNIPV